MDVMFILVPATPIIKFPESLQVQSVYDYEISHWQ